jgi:hypothetical protein
MRAQGQPHTAPLSGILMRRDEDVRGCAGRVRVGEQRVPDSAPHSPYGPTSAPGLRRPHLRRDYGGHICAGTPARDSAQAARALRPRHATTGLLQVRSFFLLSFFIMWSMLLSNIITGCAAAAFGLSRAGRSCVRTLSCFHVRLRCCRAYIHMHSHTHT